ncbi:hypothetical protein AXG93_1586s1000 [Marchantia polymorpha subsp. ruderalis]|uniref:Uncharacterized protein n=1 Tax=Marchantia polymorpha subsp. ruderalis TaxID=1480154 RepID=A0A176VH46_MARPO|nr:hypothetical protein AXG93_1586s1000 [Marchantia polymorpha subsp. ruderalis]
MLIPSHLRGTILIEDLKSKFICSIKDELEDIPLDKLHLEDEDELFNYAHSWPLIKGHTTEIESERARDLLWKRDVEAIVSKIREERMEQLESLQKGLSQQLDSLRQGLIEVENDLTHSNPENEKMVTCSNFPDMKDSNRPSSSAKHSAEIGDEDQTDTLSTARITVKGE